ncbi:MULTISPECIES: vitamin K epoxide reductase family protein [unclassified Rathayibacter]|uniref:vitamin K epoxide reductase family protein n=1 Tax=unclassified Rathayibacter TaxID=2609250 RepID=UPI00215885BB|nr:MULTISPECIES: vitamin K epoxide reductase family protein [unclassified Rathayibacter]
MSSDPGVRDAPTQQRPVVFAVLLIVLGVIGWTAAFALTNDKFAALENPDAGLGCDFSLLVQCSANLNSAQGAVFGFPNPLIGLAAWIAPIVVGLGLLAGARFDRWFWAAFNVGFLLALVFVGWLIATSVFALGTLCPWCMLTWAVVIPGFWLVTLRNLREGVFPVRAGVRRFGGAAYGWVPFITLLCYLLIAVIAQVRLNVLAYL